MSIPTEETPIPARVRDLARGAALHAVWRNAIGGLTFRADPANAAPFFIKWGPRNAEVSFREEAERMRWAARWVSAPEVIAVGEDDEHEWMATAALPGKNSITSPWDERPQVAVPAVGRALRVLHDTLPVDACPWSWSVPSRIENARVRGVIVPESLREAPPIDRLVVCHGDACMPNVLLDDRGAGTAYVDLGALGVADRWADLAPAALSTLWNCGPGWEDALVEGYGVSLDRERLTYYQDLWDAT